MPLLVFISCVFIIIISMLVLRRARRAVKWPLVGMLPSMVWNFQHLHDWATHLLIVSGGTFNLTELPWMKRVLTADPGNLEYMLKTRFHSFVKGRYVKSVFRDVMGDNNLFLEDGDYFKHLSGLTISAFSSPSFRNYSIRSVISLVHNRLLPLLRNASEKHLIIDLQDVFRRFAFDSISCNGVGFDPVSLSPDLTPVSFLDAFEEGMEACMYRMLMPAFCWKMLRYLRIGIERRVPRARKIMDPFLDNAIQFKKKNMLHYTAKGYSEGEPMDFLSILLLREQQSPNSGVPAASDANLRDFVLNILLGGMTTHAALSWFFWILDQHPRVETKILQEIRMILKQRPCSSTTLDRNVHNQRPCSSTSLDRNVHPLPPFSMEEIKEMHYLEAALRESLRLYPPAPIDLLEAAEDDVLPDGTKLEKGSIVLYFIYSAGRMQRLWGEDCGEFKPERWMTEGIVGKAESEFKYPVFNGGVRRCTGREFAFRQMKWVAASILARYEVRVVEQETHPVLPRFGLALTMKHGLLVSLRPRPPI